MSQTKLVVHDATYCDSKNLPERCISGKVLGDRRYESARNRNYDIYQRALASIVYKFFQNKTGSGISVNEQLGEG